MNSNAFRGYNYLFGSAALDGFGCLGLHGVCRAGAGAGAGGVGVSPMGRGHGGDEGLDHPLQVSAAGDGGEGGDEGGGAGHRQVCEVLGEEKEKEAGECTE